MKKFLTSKIGNILLCIAEIIVGVLLLVNPDAVTSAFIIGAGAAAHLAGVVASYTTLPVIGIPVKSSTLDGLDALLATVQMPSGIPVATVAIDGADNAAILAAQMLALSDESIAKQLHQMKVDMEQGVAKKNEALQQKVAEL